MNILPLFVALFCFIFVLFANLFFSVSFFIATLRAFLIFCSFFAACQWLLIYIKKQSEIFIHSKVKKNVKRKPSPKIDLQAGDKISFSDVLESAKPASAVKEELLKTSNEKIANVVRETYLTEKETNL